MAARAYITQKPAPPPGATASRAAPYSSQSSGTDSPDSGRQRRRRGKLKMQQRISDLVAQNGCLIELVNELSQRCACQDPCPSAEIFDLFGDDADVATSEAAVQTDISVDLNKPDVFLTLPLNIPAHADAAAGEGLRDYKSFSQDFPDFTSQNLAQAARPFAFEHGEQQQGAKAPQSTRQEQDVANALHRVSCSADFNSQSLAFSADGDLARQHVTHVHLNTRQALDVVNAKHRVSGTTDFTPRNSAPLAGPDAEGDLEQPQVEQAPQGTRQEHEDANAMYRVSGSTDFDSQCLAISAFDKEHLQCAPQSSRQALDVVVTAKHRDFVPSDFNSQSLAVPARPFAVGHQEQHRSQPCTQQELDEDNAMHRVSVSTDFNSQNLAQNTRPFAFERDDQRPGAKAPQGTRREHEVVNAMHRVSGPLDFNSQSLAISAYEDLAQKHVTHVPLCTRQELDVANAKHRVTGTAFLKPHNLVPFAGPVADGNFENHQVALAQTTTNAKHHVSGSLDFDSQNLAVSTRAAAFGSKEPLDCTLTQTSPRQELDVDNAKHRGTGTPAGDKELPLCEPAPQSSRQEHDVFNASLAISACVNLVEQLVTHAKHHRSGSFDSNSQNLACSSSAFAFGSNEHLGSVLPPSSPRQELDDDNSKHRGTSAGDKEHRQCEPAPQSSRQALDEDNAKHRDSGPPDFNSQSLALTAKPFAFEHQEQHHIQRSTRQERDVDNATHRVSYSPNSNSPLTFGPSMRELQQPLADYYTAVAPLIAAYRRRRKPTNGQVRSAAATILGIAKKHGLSKEQCCQHLQDHSLALMTAATDLW